MNGTERNETGWYSAPASSPGEKPLRVLSPEQSAQAARWFPFAMRLVNKYLDQHPVRNKYVLRRERERAYDLAVEALINAAYKHDPEIAGLGAYGGKAINRRLYDPRRGRDLLDGAYPIFPETPGMEDASNEPAAPVEPELDLVGEMLQKAGGALGLRRIIDGMPDPERYVLVAYLEGKQGPQILAETGIAKQNLPLLREEAFRALRFILERCPEP